VKSKPSILIFGGRGAIGSAVRKRFAALDWDVTATSRIEAAAPGTDSSRWITCDPIGGPPSLSQLGVGMPYAAVCWAQGANVSDSVLDFEPSRHLDVYRANCLFVLETLAELLDRDMLSRAARLVVVGSIWQRVARQSKLSYIMSKSAIGGLVQSASVDLAERGIFINAVLPSALESPMTSKSLTPAQIERIAGATGFGRLTPVDAVVGAIEFLCSERNTGITGQSVTVDLGYSHARLV